MDKLHIILKEGQRMWFTSDQHLNHKNILEFQHRPFGSVKEMNEEIIRRWNEVVGDDDIVFVVGDFDWFPSRHQMRKTIRRLSGNIYMMLGNHDRGETFELVDTGDKFHLCSDIVHLYVESEMPGVLPQKTIEIILCHYPLLTWSHVRHSIQLFGHIHSSHPKDGVEFERPLGLRKNQLDIGVDAHDFYPVSLDQVFRECGDLSEFFKGLKKINEND